jgi:hypothetical protein
MLLTLRRLDFGSVVAVSGFELAVKVFLQLRGRFLQGDKLARLFFASPRPVVVLGQ